jgi:hypothetical protein
LYGIIKIEMIKSARYGSRNPKRKGNSVGTVGILYVQKKNKLGKKPSETDNKENR